MTTAEHVHADAENHPGLGSGGPAEFALLVSVFVVAACGLVYELVAGALASYLLGDSVLQFSTVIGTYLFAMGIGSYLSRFIEHHLPAHFLRIELLVGLIGGLMPAALFLIHAYAPAPFRLALYGLVLAIGLLVGLEIPLVMRIMKRRYALKDLVSQVLTFDYLGALAVSIAFPLLFAPRLGMIRTGLLFGLMNAAVAVWALWVFRRELPLRGAHAIAAALVMLVLGAGFASADVMTRLGEDRFYGRHIVLAESSAYQRIVITESAGQVRLYLNGNLQFASRDEYRYHEALVHPVMAAHGAPHNVLVLGGGDGLAVRELLKYRSVQSVTLVDLDARITTLFSERDELVALNAGSLKSSKVHVVNQDAFAWLEQNDSFFDVVLVDLPDPTNYSLGKLYTTAFYALVDRHLAASGYAVIQTTSPLHARRSFWTVAATLEAVGLQTAPYHALVPSFGDWGFIVASHRPFRLPAELPEGLRFLTPETLRAMFEFPADMRRVPAEINRLNNQILVQTFEDEWGRIAQE
jgi:spermidine synthase